MNRFGRINLLAKVFLVLCVLLISIVSGTPAWVTLGVAVLFLGLMGFERFHGHPSLLKSIATAGIMAGICSVLVYLLFGPREQDNFHVIWGSLVALPLFFGSLRVSSPSAMRQWRRIAICVGLASSCTWVLYTYQNNDRMDFYFVLLALLGLLVLAKKWFRLPAPGILAVNTIILLIIGLPLANLFISPADSLGIPPALSGKPYSYEFFKKNPSGYARWLNYMGAQCEACTQRIYVYQSSGPLPYLLRPNSEGMLCESRITINSKGFRGVEFAAEKKDTFRIVTLGESSTFGFTVHADEKPWPELLEKLIRERLKLARPVEVINAGIPGFNLNQNLYRLPLTILPLKPDLLISYHGYNGFGLVYRFLPPVTGAAPPAYQRRPLKILADVEYRLKLDRYKKRLLTQPIPEVLPQMDPLKTGYADAYRELIGVCRANGIHLALATYSMAANRDSDPQVVQFYQQTIMALPQVISANVMHTEIVRKLTEGNPDIGFIDTHPQLDGAQEKFIDLMHFSPEGEEQMAEAVFAGIKDFLVEKLAPAP